MMTSGTLVATAGGPYVCIWDILGSGQMVRKLRNHQKTVTTIVLAESVGSEANRGPRLLSGSLDSTIKVIHRWNMLLLSISWLFAQFRMYGKMMIIWLVLLFLLLLAMRSVL